VAESLSPMIVGYLRDTTGSYGTGFAALVGVALLGAAAIALLARRPLPELKLTPPPAPRVSGPSA
jgi:cyanate permease